MKLKILLPTDFSDNAWSAVVYTLKLFKDEFCTFYFLNSIAKRLSIPYDLHNNSLKTMEEDAMKELLALKELAETSDANANHDFQIILSFEDLKIAVKKAIVKWDIDLVVMATKGATGAKELFLGSNTIHIVKSLKKCPVLIIPEEYDFIEPSQIAFSTDYNRSYSCKELNPLKLLAGLYNSKIRILHINMEEELNGNQEHNLKILQNYLKDYKSSFHWMPKYDKKTAEINDFIKELDIHILAMVNYKSSFLERIINEPIIKKIGFHPNIPFLVIPE